MPDTCLPPYNNPVRLADKVLDIIDMLPPEIGESVRRDTEAVLRQAYRVRIGDPGFRSRRDRRGAWIRRARLYRCEAPDLMA